MREVRETLRQYLEQKIIPIYATFDNGHNVNHVNAVIQKCMYYCKLLEAKHLNVDMVYTIAAYHDVGMKIQREGHPAYSKEMLLKDETLKRWFTLTQIHIMADAVEDHSTSSTRPPHTIYGKIVSDAEKDTDIDIGLMRRWYYSLKFYPNYTFDERIDDVYHEIVKRFGSQDTNAHKLMKFYFSYEDSKKFMDEMLIYINNKDKFVEKMKLLTGQK